MNRHSSVSKLMNCLDGTVRDCPSGHDGEDDSQSDRGIRVIRTKGETSVQRIDEMPQGPVDLEVAEDFASLSLSTDDWDQWALAMGAPIYMSSAWLSTWWNHYGKGLKLRLIVARSEGAIVALLPLYLEDFGFWPWKARVARLVGANLPPKVFDPPAERCHLPQVLKQIRERLATEDDCDVISIGPVSQKWGGESGASDEAWTGLPQGWRSGWHRSGVQTLFRLPQSMDEYWASLDASERKNRRKRLKHLERDYEVTTDVLKEPAKLVEAFAEFEQLHSMQWNSIGKGGHFQAWPDGLGYNQSLLREMGRLGRVAFFRLKANGTVISTRYTFMFGSVLHSELPARRVGDPWDKLGIGASSLIKFNESAIGEGIRWVDSGLGGYDHKKSLGGDESPVGIWRLERSSGIGGGRVLILKAIAWLMNLVFHKVWYRRIVPRLASGIGRTQQRFWLRYSF